MAVVVDIGILNDQLFVVEDDNAGLLGRVDLAVFDQEIGRRTPGYNT